jgi:preflagellin peptidase FlaK
LTLSTLFVVQVLSLLAGLAVAAYQDWTIREVGDRVWQAMGLFGALVGFVLFWPDPLNLLLWAVVSLWALEHLFPWDVRFERRDERLPGAIEIVVYVAAAATLVGSAVLFGVGGSGVPIALLAVGASIVMARALFEVGVLYGGADAKALIAIAILLPLDPIPLWSPAVVQPLLSLYPFAVTVLVDAALLAAVVPIGIAVRNLSRGEFAFPRGFTGYTIPVDELPDRFVWIKDPTFSRPGPNDEPEPETTEEDRELRWRQAEELRKEGVRRVWVTPQLPFILWIAAGVVAALVAGNLIFDLAASL